MLNILSSRGPLSVISHDKSAAGEKNPVINGPIEIDLSGAVAFRQRLRLVIFGSLFALSFVLTFFQGQFFEDGIHRQDAILLTFSILIVASLVALYHWPGKGWQPVALYGAVVAATAALAYLSILWWSTANTDSYTDVERFSLVIFSAIILYVLLLWAPSTIATSQARATLTLALRRKTGRPPYWLFVLRNARWTLLNLLLVILIMAGIVLLAALPLIFGFFLIPCLAGIRILWSTLMARLSRTLPWSSIVQDRSRRGTCLYLRSFWDDDAAFSLQSLTDYLQQQWTSGVRARIFGRAWIFLHMYPMQWLFEPRTQRLEEIVVRSVWSSYAVVAIGHSSSDDAPMAAVRFSLEDDDWQTIARQLAQEAQLIVLLSGYTGGVKWEHVHLKTEGLLRKTILVFPPEDAENHRDRWKALLEHNSGELGISQLGEYDAYLMDQSIACMWTEDGRRLHFTPRATSRVAYDLVMRLACAPVAELLSLE